MSYPVEDLVHPPVQPYICEECGRNISFGWDHAPTCSHYTPQPPPDDGGGSGGGDDGGTLDDGQQTLNCGKTWSEVTFLDCRDCVWFFHNNGDCMGYLQS
jgi:hypothetical protein